MSYDATPPRNILKNKHHKFPSSYDLQEGKKSTVVRTGAPAR